MKFTRSHQSWRVEEAFSNVEGSLETLVHRSGYNIGDMCAELQCSQRHIYDVFLRDIGTPPQQWVDALRMQVARQMLANKLPIREVSERLGYSSVVAFTRRFGRTQGKPPGRYVSELAADGAPVSKSA